MVYELQLWIYQILLGMVKLFLSFVVIIYIDHIPVVIKRIVKIPFKDGDMFVHKNPSTTTQVWDIMVGGKKSWLRNPIIINCFVRFHY